jgi:histidyl-tRNA synthetase
MKPSIPDGTRDFNATTIYKRNYIINTIRTVFETYGFEPLETPAFEKLTTLMGKYGDEGDKLIFKILNNGINDPKNIDKTKAAFENVMSTGKNDSNLTDRALKYDLTIPFARYVAMNYAQLTMPFKRYQIQPVWRADRPQKGRYREFYQCDADVVGSNSLWNEADLLNIYNTVFTNLKLSVTIKINNRKILMALATLINSVNNMQHITVAIDKLDKIGIEKVKEELLERGLQETQVNTIEQYLLIKGDNEAMLTSLQLLLGDISIGAEGITELKEVLEKTALQNSANKIQIDQTLARGLHYYTGTIIEISANDFVMGSIGGGGRYNDLTALFGVPNVPGVGISFGLDRIYDVLEGLSLFPDSINKAPTVLFLNMDKDAANAIYLLVQQLRNRNIAAEMYPEPAKIDKQYKYAEKKGIPFVINIGTKELAEDVCQIKNITTGIMQKVSLMHLNNYNFTL